MENDTPEMKDKNYYGALKDLLSRENLTKLELWKKLNKMAKGNGGSVSDIVENCFHKAVEVGDRDFADILFSFMMDSNLFGEEVIMNFVMTLEGLEDLYFFDLFRDTTEEKRAPFSILRLHCLSQMDVPLLIIGETGTSKELLVRAIHRISNRRKQRLVEINCAAIPETLLEAELFGCEKWAFTGAVKRIGILAEAGKEKGTVFLDEIGKMSDRLQAKLLKAVEEKKVAPLGSNKPVEIDVRFIAAAQPVDARRIIPDLLYRLGFPNCIQVPTLKERMKAEPTTVIENSWKRAMKNWFPSANIKHIPELSQSSWELLLNYEYSGNYRELENILSSAVVSSQMQGRIQILPEDLEEAMKISKEFYSDGKEGLLPSGKQSLEDVKLKDIIDYANGVGRSIVETKVKAVLKSGKKLKAVLRDEGMLRGYDNFMKKIRSITGKNIRELGT